MSTTTWRLFDPRVGVRDLTPNEPTARDDGAWLVESAPLDERVTVSTLDFLDAVHPQQDGWLAIQALAKGKPPRPVEWIKLPFGERGARVLQYYAQANAGYDLYHRVAAYRDHAGARLSNASTLAALFVEIDLKRGAPLLDVWNRLQSFELAPSAVVHSGGGLHVYWLLRDPIDLSTDLGVARAYHWLHVLAARVGGEPESREPNRMLRIPDTANLKPEYGRTPPRVTLVDSDWTARYTREEIVALLGDADPSHQPIAVHAAAATAIDHGIEGGARLKMAGAWLAEQPPAVEGDSGDAHTFQVCCAVAVGHDLDEDDALLALRDWNARCEPPWEERELRQKVRNAIAYATEQRGGRLAEFPTTEVGDAEFFVERHGQRVRYDFRRRRWVIAGDSGLWVPDPVEQLRGLAVETMRERRRRAALVTDKDRSKALFNWAIAGEQTRRLDHMLREARAIAPIADPGDGWDADSWLLGVRNGVVDLRTGALRDAQPEDRVTMTAAVAFDAAARCPLWERTLGEIFGGDGEMVGYVQRALGYSLTGDTREECLFLCWGDGANGKGTLMNTVAWALADYADDLPFSALELHDRAGIPNDVAKLVGKRFVTASESGDARLNEARVKALTGRDPITARFMRAEFFTFQPVAKFWLATNTKPTVRDNSEGFWRRLHLIPFTQSFAGREDKTLKDRLRDEAPGILAWAVRGALGWQRDGLRPPEAVVKATTAYRSEQQQIDRFIDARCETGEGARGQAGPLFESYRRWCDGRRERPEFNRTTFGMEMKKRFDVDPQEKRHTWYLGVGLRASDLDDFV